MAKELRKFQVMSDGIWADVNLKDVKKGDSFCAFEEDGTPVNIDDKTVFVAAEDAKYNKEVDSYCVIIEPLPEDPTEQEIL